MDYIPESAGRPAFWRGETVAEYSICPPCEECPSTPADPAIQLSQERRKANAYIDGTGFLSVLRDLR
jgi:hypothetical protein